MRLQLKDISDSEFNTMHAAILRLLDEFGVLFENEEARRLLANAGNRLDEEGRIHLQPGFVESMLKFIPTDGFTLYGRDEAKAVRVAVDHMCFRPSTGEPFLFDYETRSRRPATMEDSRTLVRVTDALEGYDMVNSVVNVDEAPGSWGNILRFVNAHGHSLKPSDITVSTDREVRAVARIGTAIRGSEEGLREKPLTAVDVAMISPLRCTDEETRAFLECARRGIPVEILTSPSLGVSSPLTLAGGVALTMAETVAALCLLYQVAPGLGVINVARVSPINLRSGAYNYGAPELGMGSVLTAACSARYHLPTNLYGFGTAAKTFGGQAEMEKVFSGLLMALGRHHLITGAGTLDNSLITGPELLVVDHEAIRFIKRIVQPIPIDEQAIGIDALISEMKPGGTMMASEHTLEYMRQGAMVDCSLDQWGSLHQWEQAGQPDLLDAAHKKVKHSMQPTIHQPYS